jgi:NADH-quinone oxidoreductase subunit H
LSTISLPWIEPEASVRTAQRKKAIGLLLTLGLIQLAMAGALFVLFKLGVANQIRDWKVLVALLGVAGPALGGMAFVLGGLAVIAYRQIGAFLRWGYVALSLFLGGVVGICLLVWAHALLFRVVSGLIADPSINGDAVVDWGFVAPLTVREIHEGLVTRHAFDFPFAAYLLWPLQFEIVRDLLAMAGIIGFISIVPLFGIWWERKVAGRMQSRLGPMRVGGWHGWAQSFADGIKLIFKEDLVPAEGDRLLFRLAPYLTFVPAVCAFIALPFAGAYVFRDLDVALIFILAMLGIEVVGVILAGWASNNKWSVYGAMREACQMVSYEIPMGMALLIPVMMAGTLQLTEIANKQAGGFADWFAWRNPWCFIAFFCYYTASLASCKRAPFDLPESESELVAGFHTEYSGFRWSLFFFAEYAAMFAVSGLAVILFLGAWKSPLPAHWADDLGTGWGADIIRGVFFDGPILFVLKAGFLFYVQLWVRWTLPRIRIDQVLYSCIQVLLPLTMIVLLANTLWILAVDRLAWMHALDQVIHWVLVVIGAAAFVVCFVIAIYGYINRRRLPGPLVIEHLPWA